MKITLCGSTRFKDLFIDANKRLTAAGHAVYSVAFHGHAENAMPDEDTKETLDLVHLLKILESTCIVIITDDTGYYGDSTRREIKWARIIGRPIWWWNVPDHRRKFFDNDDPSQPNLPPELRFFRDREVESA